MLGIIIKRAIELAREFLHHILKVDECHEFKSLLLKSYFDTKELPTND